MSEHEMTERELQDFFNVLIKKENNLLLFKNGNKKIFILGTIHHYHLIEANDYSLAHVQSVIETILPGVLMIETRSNTLEKYNAVDGPIEMLFSRCYADEHGITVKGIDWWQVVKDNKTMYALDLERDDRMFENIISAAVNYDRVLVLCGAEHRGRMPQRFIANGYIQVEISDILSYFNNTHTPFRYPKRMAEEYHRAVTYYQTGFLEEVNRNISKNDELYEHFSKFGKKDQNDMIEMFVKNKLYK